MVALSATRSRLIRNIGTGTVEYQRVVNATLITFGTLAVVAFLLQLEIARGYLAVALPLGLTLLLARPRHLALPPAPHAPCRPLHHGVDRRRPAR